MSKNFNNTCSFLENFLCPKEQIRRYFTVLKQHINSFENIMKSDINSFVNREDPDQLAFHTTCEFVMINQNINYRIVLIFFMLVPGQVNINSLLVLNQWDQVGQIWHGIL